MEEGPFDKMAQEGFSQEHSKAEKASQAKAKERVQQVPGPSSRKALGRS